MEARREGPPHLWTALVVAVVAWASAGAAAAEVGSWSVELKAVYVEVTGHDPQVLLESGPDGTAATRLETDSALGYGAAVALDRGRWRYGLDFFIHRADQGVGARDVSAAGPGQPRAFEIPRRTFVSTGPDEPLYFRTLEDTTVELWVVDLYARRELGAAAGGPWGIVFGLRNADFDNDYRAIAGIEGVEGTRLDASSNYSRMIGPMAGLGARLERGRHSFEAELRAAVVFGDIELSRTLRDFQGPSAPFAGPPEEVPPALAEERLHQTDSIEVPMTDLRLAWRYRPGERWIVGIEAAGIGWWGLAVPPGVDPARPDAREETDLVTWGIAASVGFRF